MAGHSKWANIKHKKGRSDAKKGKLFSRLTKEIISAVKQGGADPKSNTKLRIVIQKAKGANLPSETIERNIKKASNQDQSDFQEVTYELYGYGGVGIIAQALTDNKNRTASEMRIATNKKGGTVATPGSVSFNFERKGILQVAKEGNSEDALFGLATECGAEDFDQTETTFVIVTRPETLYEVREKLEERGVVIEEGSLEMIPKSSVTCTEEIKKANHMLIEWLENIDDVDMVYHNMEE